MNKPYVKKYDENGVITNPITKDKPYLTQYSSNRGLGGSVRPFNNRAGNRGEKLLITWTDKLIGSSIMVVLGSKDYEKAPYETIQKDGKIIQKLNRLCYVEFERSKKDTGESAIHHFMRDYDTHIAKLDLMRETNYPEFQTKILDKYYKTSKKTFLN